jgi:diaminopimelate decarboxylase
VAPYLDALDRLLDLVEAVEAEGIRIGHIDVGGGLGITYTDEAPPDADVLVSRLMLSASTPAATAIARCCSSPGVRWWAMPVCC